VPPSAAPGGEHLAPAVGELVGRVAAVDPALLGEFAAIRVAVVAQAAALEATLRHFSALEGRLCRAVEAVGAPADATVSEEARERQFAAMLDYVGSSAVRTRVERLVAAFPA